MIAIYINRKNVRFRFNGKTIFVRFLETSFSELGLKKGVVSYTFCDDTFLLDINRQYLKHDFFTDIITFDLSQNQKELLADIYISIDTVRLNAKKYHVSFNEELKRVMIHGMLHLAGYNDGNKKEVDKIREMEEHYLKMFHVKHSQK